MTKTTAINAFSRMDLPMTHQSITFKLAPLPSSEPVMRRMRPTPVDQRITLSLRPLKDEVQCQGDGTLAFAIPWMAITLLGTYSSFGQSTNALVLEAILPGLMAGASGLLLYKATKKLVHYLHSELAQSTQ